MIGADIEEFVLDSSGNIVSSIGLIGGDKHHPVWVTHGNIQEDNVLAEYAIHPASSRQQFLDHVQGLRAELYAHLKSVGYDATCIATHEYDRDTLIGFGKAALQFGCSAEYNAWCPELWACANRINVFSQGIASADMEDRYRVVSPSPYTELRTAGGHVHFSYENPTDKQTLKIIRALDYVLGTWSVMHDTDRVRRRMYGKAGYCRIKQYGGEYRTLSNFWVQSQEMIGTVYDLTQSAVLHADLVTVLGTICSSDEVQRAINEYDVAACTRIHTEAKAILA